MHAHQVRSAAKYLSVVLFALALSFCTSTKSKPTNKNEINHDMNDLAGAFSRVIPDTTSDVFPEAFSQRQRVIQDVKTLRKMSHKVAADNSKFSSDPRFVVIAGRLQANLDSGLRQLEHNHWRAGIRRVAQATQSCVACHAMESGAPQLNAGDLDANVNALEPVARGDYFVATRQFDRAIDQYESVLADPDWEQSHAKLWPKVFVKLVAITVRVKNDPNLLLELISRFFDTRTIPPGLQTIAQSWRAQAKAWRDEQSSSKPASNSEAERFLAMADKLESKKPQSGLVLYLRASAIISRQLHDTKPADLTAKEMYEAGRAEQGLASAIVWTFPDAYYARCVQLARNNTSMKKYGALCHRRLHAIERENL